MLTFICSIGSPSLTSAVLPGARARSPLQRGDSELRLSIPLKALIPVIEPPIDVGQCGRRLLGGAMRDESSESDDQSRERDDAIEVARQPRHDLQARGSRHEEEGCRVPIDSYE